MVGQPGRAYGALRSEPRAVTRRARHARCMLYAEGALLHFQHEAGPLFGWVRAVRGERCGAVRCGAIRCDGSPHPSNAHAALSGRPAKGGGRDRAVQCTVQSMEGLRIGRLAAARALAPLHTCTRTHAPTHTCRRDGHAGACCKPARRAPVRPKGIQPHRFSGHVCFGLRSCGFGSVWLLRLRKHVWRAVCPSTTLAQSIASARASSNAPLTLAMPVERPLPRSGSPECSPSRRRSIDMYVPCA